MRKSVIHRHNRFHILALTAHYLAPFNSKLNAELIQQPFCCFTFYILPKISLFQDVLVHANLEQ
jgi:hypothetical protein